LTKQLAKHLREVYFGGNWTWVNLKETLADITWEQATMKISDFNTIAALVYHINYYVEAITKVLRDQPLDSKDKFSFSHPPIDSQEDWERMVNSSLAGATELAGLIEQLPESRLDEVFYEEKYGSYLRNFLGLIEHTHYHLGQIVLIKKLVRAENLASI
jgi:hypothetical protein